MFLPDSERDLLDKVKDLKEQCFSSLEDRQNLYGTWRNYLFFGSDDPGDPALLNKCGPHADRLHSYLFSPSEVRAEIDFGQRAHESWQRREVELARHITKEFHGSDVDMCFGDAVYWSLPLGSAFVKLGIKMTSEPLPEAADDSWLRSLWSKKGRRRPSTARGIVSPKNQMVFAGFDPYVVLPSAMGVYREDMNGLDRQEVIVHRTPITMQELFRRLRYHPDRNEIIKKVQASNTVRTPEQTDEFIHQVIIGGPNRPVAGGGYGTGGGNSSVEIMRNAPSADLDPKVVANLCWFVELWIMDDERQDYTTIQYVEPDVLIEGGTQRRNLFISGHHPFCMVQPNEQQGYFWGRSEFSDLYMLQDAINDRLDDIMHITALEAQPAHAMMGFTGNVEEMKRAMLSRNGLLVSDMPSGKIENLAPKLPDTAYTNLKELVSYFDEIAGFTPIMQGTGEQGVRAGTHASSLQRSASARIKDRALRVERQCADLLGLCFSVMADKDPTMYGEKNGEGYLLSQVPEDRAIRVDAHSSSPAFQEDNKQLAFALKKADAITNEGLLMMVHPPMLDQLLQQLADKQAAQQKFAQEHPDLIAKQATKRKR